MATLWFRLRCVIRLHEGNDSERGLHCHVPTGFQLSRLPPSNLLPTHTPKRTWSDPYRLLSQQQWCFRESSNFSNNYYENNYENKLRWFARPAESFMQLSHFFQLPQVAFARFPTCSMDANGWADPEEGFSRSHFRWASWTWLGQFLSLSEWHVPW